MNQSETIVSEENYDKNVDLFIVLCLFIAHNSSALFVFISYYAIFWAIKNLESPLASLRFFDHCNFICFSKSKNRYAMPKNVNNWCHESCLTLPSVGCILENKNLKVLKYHIHKLKIDCIERVKMQYMYGSTTHEYRF